MLYNGWIGLGDKRFVTQDCWNKTIQQWQGQLQTRWDDLDSDINEGIVEAIAESPIKIQKPLKGLDSCCRSFQAQPTLP